MANILGSENISKLSSDRVYHLLSNATNKDEMAKLIVKHKKELSDGNVYALLKYAENKDEIKKLLREKGINVD